MKTHQTIILALIQDHCDLELEPVNTNLFNDNVITLVTTDYEIDLMWYGNGLLETQLWRMNTLQIEPSDNIETKEFDANNSIFTSDLSNYLLKFCKDLKVKMRYNNA